MTPSNPVTPQTTPDQPVSPTFPGTLRDWFAGHVDVSGSEVTLERMTEFTGIELDEDRDPLTQLLEMSAMFHAKLRYMHADAMLKAREEKP